MTFVINPPANIKINLNYYNDSERQLFTEYPSANQIIGLISNGIVIPTAEFLTYYLFHRKRRGVPEYRDYYTIRGKIGRALIDLEGCIESNQDSIYSLLDATHQDNGATEYIGESIGLSTISRLHGLTDADWDPIPQHRGRGAPPTFDYQIQIASNGNQFIQVENKGSIVADNRIASNALSNHERNIKYKKRKIGERVLQNNYPYPASLRYGTITALDQRRDGGAYCYLIDPDPDYINDTPRRFRLLTRMRFLRDWISFISPNSQLTSALSTRIADLENLRDPFELDNVPLLKKDGVHFNYYPLDRLGFNLTSTFWNNKSRITDGPAGGTVVQISENNLFFIGFRDDIIDLSIKQNFSDITNYITHNGTILKTVECVFSRTRYERLLLPPHIKNQVREKGQYFSFRLPGRIHYSSSGLVFGVLPLNNI